MFYIAQYFVYGYSCLRAEIWRQCKDVYGENTDSLFEHDVIRLAYKHGLITSVMRWFELFQKNRVLMGVVWPHPEELVLPAARALVEEYGYVIHRTAPHAD